MKNNYIISIGRQLGSGGYEIGKKLAEQLDFSFYDKELINLASKESGLEERFFEKVDEKMCISYFDNFFGLQFSKNYLGGDSLFQIQSDLIQKLAKQNSCVFVGRCADYILRDHPKVLNIFICADEKDRAKRTAKRKNISEKKAKVLNIRVDKTRKEYYNFYTNKYWGRASSYDLCINSSILGIDDTAEFIASFFNKFKISLNK